MPAWADPPPPVRAQAWAWIKAFANRHDRTLPAAAAVLVMLLLIGGWHLFHPAVRVFTQGDIDNAVKYTLSHTDPPPADTTIAAAVVGPSVVRVEGYLSPERPAAGAQAD